MYTRTVVENPEALDMKIEELVLLVRQNQGAIAQHEAEIQQAKETLAALLEEKGTGWSDSSGYARLVAEGTRTSYKTEELDNLILHDPLRYGWLKDYRAESKIAGRVQVK